MANPTDADSFPAADADASLNPGKDKDFQVDPVSAEVATSLDMKERAEAAEIEEMREKVREGKDTLQTLKKAVMISAVIVAVAGAAFAITKKLKEK